MRGLDAAASAAWAIGRAIFYASTPRSQFCPRGHRIWSGMYSYGWCSHCAEITLDQLMLSGNYEMLRLHLQLYSLRIARQSFKIRG